ncbi:MAG: T9SS type A sorting domain-containing protein, partial [candidate division WOR-3 bacterium]
DSTTVALMRTIQDTMSASTHWYIGMTWWYGLSQFSGRWVWGHVGGWLGTTTAMWFCPAENSGAIILTNRFVHGWNDLGPMIKELLDWALQYGIAENQTAAPTIVNLEVTPNPFKQMTDIRYQMTDNGVTQSEQEVNIKIYDVSGRLAKDFGPLSVIGHQSSVQWDGTDQSNRKLPGGVYFVTLHAGEFSETKKVLIVR